MNIIFAGNIKFEPLKNYFKVFQTVIYRRILQGFAVVGRVVSSRDRVKVLDLQKYCRDLHITITDTSPWVLFGESVHRCDRE